MCATRSVHLILLKSFNNILQTCQPNISSLHLFYSIHPAILSVLDPDRQIMLSTPFLKGDRGGTVVKVASSIPDGVIVIFH